MDDIYLNGKFIKKSDAQISIMDRGFLFGDGVYELIPVYNKKVFLLHKHLDRLKNSLNLIGMNFIDELEQIINKLILGCDKNNFYVYLHITRGQQPHRNHIYPKSIEPTVLIMLEEYPSYDENQIMTGFSACIQEDFRWLKSNIKSISLLGNVLLKNLANADGCYETLLIRDNKLTEGSASNVFMVKNNQIMTPKLTNELLPGVTRDLLIELLNDKQIKVTEAEISQEELLNADEVWCSSSTNAVVPIVKVDNIHIGSGKTGKVSCLAHKIVRDFVMNY